MGPRVAALERIRQMLVDRAAMLANVTTEPANWAAFEPQLADFLATLPLGNVPRAIEFGALALASLAARPAPRA